MPSTISENISILIYNTIQNTEVNVWLLDLLSLVDDGKYIDFLYKFSKIEHKDYFMKDGNEEDKNIWLELLSQSLKASNMIINDNEDKNTLELCKSRTRFLSELSNHIFITEEAMKLFR